jgi:hypothetical protein
VGRPRKAIINSSSFSLKARKKLKIPPVSRSGDLFRIWIEPVKTRPDPNAKGLNINREFVTVNTLRGEGQQGLFLFLIYPMRYGTTACTGRSGTGVYWSVLVSRIKKNKCCHLNSPNSSGSGSATLQIGVP